jgi:hypothetical protein
MKQVNKLSEYEPPPRLENLLRKMKKVPKISSDRLFYEKIRQLCILGLEQYTLKPGECIIASGGDGILDVSVTNLTGHEKELTQEELEKGHKFEVYICSSVRGILNVAQIRTTGSTALEAMTAAMRELEDDLCPSTARRKRFRGQPGPAKSQARKVSVAQQP